MSQRSLQALLGFVLLVVTLDFALGSVFDRLYRRTFTGERGGLLNLALTKDADILVLGSSRAQFQVVPAALSEYLPGKIYNAGLKGHDLLYAAMLLDLWERRHSAPRAVILTVDMESLLKRPNELSAAQIFAPYFEVSPRVRAVLYQDGPYKRLVYLSRAFRYNGKVLAILKNLSRGPDPSYDGYLPSVGKFIPHRGLERHGLMDIPEGEPPSDSVAVRLASGPYWDFKIDLLQAMAQAAQRGGYRLFLVHPPIYGLSSQAHATWQHRLKQLTATMPAVEVMDFCEYGRPREMAGHPELFSDFNHLNVEGARLFSNMLGQSVADAMTRSSAAARTSIDPR